MNAIDKRFERLGNLWSEWIGAPLPYLSVGDTGTALFSAPVAGLNATLLHGPDLGPDSAFLVVELTALLPPVDVQSDRQLLDLNFRVLGLRRHIALSRDIKSGTVVAQMELPLQEIDPSQLADDLRLLAALINEWRGLGSNHASQGETDPLEHVRRVGAVKG